MHQEETQVERWVRIMGPVSVEESMFSKDRNDLESRMGDHEYVDVLYPTAGCGSYEGSFSPGINHEPVLFHKNHDYENVIKCWLSENQQILVRSSAWAVYHNLCQRDYSEELLEAAKNILSDKEGWR